MIRRTGGIACRSVHEVAQKKITVEDAHIRFDVPVFAADRQVDSRARRTGARCELHALRGWNRDLLHVLRAAGCPFN